MPTKIEVPDGFAPCCGCKQILSKSDFYPSKIRRRGVSSYCRKCSLEMNRKRFGYKAKNVFSKDWPEGQAWCSKCKTFKALGDFSKYNDPKRNGVQGTCRACQAAYRQIPEVKKRMLACSLAWQRVHRRHPLVHKYKFPEARMTLEIASYIAGLFDAEGTFTIQDGAPKTALYNNNKGLLEWVAQHIGGALYPIERENGWIEYQLAFTNQPIVKAVCQSLIPHLTLKRRRAEIIVECMEKERCERTGLAVELRALNRKGQKITPPEKTEAVQTALGDISASEWAYFAGWLDGDGCLIMIRLPFNGQRYCYPQIHIYSTKADPLLRIHKAFGGMIDSRKREERDAIEVCLSFEDQDYVAKLLTGLRPYLVGKKDQLELALSAMQYHPTERNEEAAKMQELNARFRNPNPTPNATHERRKQERSQKLPSTATAEVPVMRVYDLADYASGSEKCEVIKFKELESVPLQAVPLSEYAK